MAQGEKGISNFTLSLAPYVFIKYLTPIFVYRSLGYVRTVSWISRQESPSVSLSNHSGRNKGKYLGARSQPPSFAHWWRAKEFRSRNEKETKTLFSKKKAAHYMIGGLFSF